MKQRGREYVGVGLIGLGTVGSEVFTLLQESGDVAARAGARIRVTKVAVSRRDKARTVEVPQGLLTEDAADVVESPDVGIVVELIGGLEPARTILLDAIERGKAVVTANKQLMAASGPEILDRAEAHQVDVGFEGSVGAGIPLIKPIRESLAAAQLRSVVGILNGTTNYILTRMTEEGLSFDAALSAAREQGFAEANPAEDVEGHDAAAKLAILASAALHLRVTGADVYREGISRITPQDIEFARELGFVIKLLAVARRSDGGIEARVHPTLIRRQSPLAAVAHESNAVLVEGPGLGQVMFSGKGAGGASTAVAVVGDIIDIARGLQLGVPRGGGLLHLQLGRVRPIEDVVLPYYLRLQVTDRPGVFARVATVFGEEQVSIASIVQKTRGATADVVLITHETPERAVRAVVERLSAMDVVKAVSNVLRVD